jgi:hypothetical protein
MSRRVAVIWHASFCVAAGVLYFFFTLPRWPELLGDTPHALGTVLRIVAGALIGLAALPVVFTLLRTRRPEFGTPQLALSLRNASIVLHALAGVLIIGAAISEIWLSLDDAGQWLFGIYGAAAAIALLGMFAFYLAFVAELPPPPPKPRKPKKQKQRRGRRKAADEAEVEAEADAADDAADDAAEEGEPAESEAEPAEVTAEAHEAEEAEPAAEEAESTAEQPTSTAQDEPAAADEEAHEDDEADQSTNGKLRNRRPSGKTPTRRRRRRLRGGVAVED